LWQAIVFGRSATPEREMRTSLAMVMGYLLFVVSPVLAQATGGAGGTAGSAGGTAGSAGGAAGSGGLADWWWVILLVIVVVAAIWYFTSRRPRV
jgi:hypothetical protein